MSLRFLLLTVALISAPQLAVAAPPSAAVDPYQWLEAPSNPLALIWAKEHSAQTKAELAAAPIYPGVAAELNSATKAAPPSPSYSLLGSQIVRFQKSVEHPHGVLEVAVRGADGVPGAWTLVLDIDALRASEGKSFELHTSDFDSACLPPTFDRCLLSLSPAGADDVELREFDLRTGKFVTSGFVAPAGRTQFTWLDRDTVLIASTQVGDLRGATGWPLSVHLWKRGQALKEAREVWHGQPTDAIVTLSGLGEGATRRGIVTRAIDYSNFAISLVDTDGRTNLAGLPVRVKSFGVLAGTSRHLIFATAEPCVIKGQNVPADALIAYDADPTTPTADRVSVVYAPKTGEVIIAQGTVPQVAATKSHVEFVLNNHLRQRIVSVTFSNDRWIASSGKPVPAGDSVGIAAANPVGEDYLRETTGFITPTRMDLVAPNASTRRYYTQDPIFDASGYKVEVHTAVSRDGTSVDYYLLAPRRPAHPGLTPTLITGYGAFGIVFQPGYFDYSVGGTSFQLWLNRGGALALPAIRGGGEHGEAWHRAAMRENRQRSYDDLIAVVQNLENGFTTPQHMGVFGSSNGGLLAATVGIERPDLFGAVISDVPLTDMIRLPFMGMGAAWLNEYGDPSDLVMRKALLAYSPYQNVRNGVHYPPFMITDSTSDNRVGPGHARKLAARLLEVGAKAYLFEDQEGGHGVSDPLEHPDLMSLRMTFLIDTLMRK